MGQMIVLANATTPLVTVLDKFSTVVQSKAVIQKSPRLEQKHPPNRIFYHKRRFEKWQIILNFVVKLT